MIITINELSSCSITVSFKNEKDQPVAPLSFTYRIDDLQSSTQLLGDALVLNPGVSYEIKIPSTTNNILIPENIYESKKLTVKWTYTLDGISKQGTDEFIYQVKNLTFLH